MNLKQIFCKHIWTKLDEWVETIDTREFVSDYGGINRYADYQYYAQHRKCLKCGTTKVVEKKVVII